MIRRIYMTNASAFAPGMKLFVGGLSRPFGYVWVLRVEGCHLVCTDSAFRHIAACAVRRVEWFWYRASNSIGSEGTE